MNRRAFLLALPAVAAVGAVAEAKPRAVHGAQIGTREAIVEANVPCGCEKIHAQIEFEHAHAVRVLAARRASGEDFGWIGSFACARCGSVYNNRGWWRRRPLTHPGAKA